MTNKTISQPRTHKCVEQFLYGRVVSKEPEPLPVGKICTKCQRLRVSDKFQIDRKGKYGRKSACKECSAKKDKLWASKRRAA